MSDRRATLEQFRLLIVQETAKIAEARHRIDAGYHMSSKPCDEYYAQFVDELAALNGWQADVDGARLQYEREIAALSPVTDS